MPARRLTPFLSLFRCLRYFGSALRSHACHFCFHAQLGHGSGDILEKSLPSDPQLNAPTCHFDILVWSLPAEDV